MRKVLFYCLAIISVVTFVNIVILYWFPITTPLSSYLAVALMAISYWFESYYLILIPLLICVVIFLSSISVLKKQIIWPVVVFIYLISDLGFLAQSLFDAWINDDYFIVMQAIQIVIYSSVVVLLCIYFVSLWKEQKISKKVCKNKQKKLGQKFK